MSTRKVMVVFGTRPEAIKMAPVITALRAQSGIQTLVAVTAQHRQMLDQVLDLFGITPDDDLDVMRANQNLSDLFARILTGMSEVISRRQPDLVLVHGDTSTTLATALAAFYANVPVGHVEAGLRTGSMAAPWPEEMNRRLTAPLTRLHFAPTARARSHLLAEGINASDVHVTGNTVVDALLEATAQIQARPALKQELNERLSYLDPGKRLILVTGHRRENFGHALEQICRAIQRIVARGDAEVVYPVHLNPNIKDPVTRILGGEAGVHLTEPQEYLPFVHLMARADIIITDSGGIQEEAPSLGKPVLLMRDSTERPEAVDAGTVRLVGTHSSTICSETARLLDNPEAYQAMANAENPYGDGKSARRIARIISEFWK